MQIDFVANITVSASLQIIFATDTRSSLAGMVIGFPRTLCFAAKTVRSLGELHCSITKQHCSITEIVNCFAQKSFTLNHRAVPSPELTCFIAKRHCFAAEQHCLITNPHCFFVKPHWFVTKTLCSVTVKPISGTGQPCFLPETLTSIGQILACVTDSIISEAHQLDFPTKTFPPSPNFPFAAFPCAKPFAGEPMGSEHMRLRHDRRWTYV